MRNQLFVPLSRGVALSLGGFSLLNLMGDLRTPGFDANLWWIDFRPLPAWLAQSVLACGAVLLIAFAAAPHARPARRWLTLAGVGALAAVAVSNAVEFYQLVFQGRIRSGCPVPFSLLVTAALVGVGLAVWWARPGLFAAGHPWRSRAFVAAATGACAVAFPLAQMWCFGKTDYRRPADAIVVFGAKAKANGEPSSALEERVRTACDLYLQGLAPRLVFSGGPGAGSVHETEAMRRLAIELGVRDSDIVLDRQGLDTQATVRNTSELFARMGVRRVLAVSHFYHLPRIKLTYHREGWEVYTVPAKPIWVLRHYPFYMLREVAALWVYYLRPLSISASRI